MLCGHNWSLISVLGERSNNSVSNVIVITISSDLAESTDSHISSSSLKISKLNSGVSKSLFSSDMWSSNHLVDMKASSTDKSSVKGDASGKI